MPSVVPKVADRRNFAKVLAERLSAVAKEHHDWLWEQRDEEMESLRAEVLMLRGEMSELNHALASSKTVEGSRTPPGLNDTWDGDCAVSADCGQPGCEKHSPEVVSDHVFQSTAQDGLEATVPRADYIKGISAQDGLEAIGPPAGYLKSMSAAQRKSSNKIFDDFEENAELEQKFAELDPDQKGYIDINILAEELTKNLPPESHERSLKVRKYRVAVSKLNQSLGAVSPDTRAEHINYNSFQVLMREEPDVLRDAFGPVLTESFLELREALLYDVIVQEIAKTCRIKAQDLCTQPLEDAMPKHKHKILLFLEPVSGIAICLNAILLGVSLDVNPEWQGWIAIEAVFCCFFIGELLTAVYVFGCGDHFLGEDWAWSWFDLLIVCSATADIFLTLMNNEGGTTGPEPRAESDDSGFSHVMVMRLIRLIRVMRLLRILKLKVFKELTLMINGVIAGSRTLLWAIVLLTLFMYVLGVVMRQVMTLEENQKWCDTTSDCRRGALYMQEYGHIMFGSVGRSMLATFTCFTEGCNGPDGTPFIWHLWDTRGPVLVVGYVLAFMFISFGVFNLILAVFVEVTLSHAKQTDADRQFGSPELNIQKAKNLYKILVKLCKAYDNGGPTTSKGPQSRKKKGLRKLMDQFARNKIRSEPHLVEPGHLRVKLSQDQFEAIMDDAEVKDTFEDLEISDISRRQLFDILDADGNGLLSIGEIVDGVMKLRGPTDKGDIVGIGLSVRQLQREFHKIEHWMLRQNKQMSASVQTLTELTERLGVV